jgi:hypothetical protein
MFHWVLDLHLEQLQQVSFLFDHLVKSIEVRLDLRVVDHYLQHEPSIAGLLSILTRKLSAMNSFASLYTVAFNISILSASLVDSSTDVTYINCQGLKVEMRNFPRVYSLKDINWRRISRVFPYTMVVILMYVLRIGDSSKDCGTDFDATT